MLPDCRIALQPKVPREDLALQRASKPQKFQAEPQLVPIGCGSNSIQKKIYQWHQVISQTNQKKIDRSLPPKPPYCDYSQAQKTPCWAAATSGHQALSAKTRRTAVEHLTKSTSVTLQTSENGFVSTIKKSFAMSHFYQ